MARFKLSHDDDWQLVHADQDIRGWPVKNATGARLGTVDELIADTDSELVEGIVLDDGRELPARDVVLEDGAVLVAGTAGGDGAAATPAATPTAKTYETARVHRRPVAAGTAASALVYDDHRDAFRSHCRTTYGPDGDRFETYEPAYRFGFTSGAHSDYRDRDYADVETDLRRRFEDRHGEGTFKTMSHAVKYGFNHARGL